MSEQFFSICRAAFAESETYFTPELYAHVTSDEVLTRMYKITEKLVENAKKFNLTSILEPEEIIKARGGHGQSGKTGSAAYIGDSFPCYF